MIRDFLGKQLLFFDGAMGTELHSIGLKASELPEVWNIKEGKLIQDIHKKYLNAGSDILKTNTFGCNSVKMSATGYTVEEIIKHAVENARIAIKECNTSKPRYIALDIGPLGKLLKPLGDLHFNLAYELFKEIVIIGTREKADLILIETMSCTYELKAAVLAAKENSNLPIIASITLDEKGRMLTGGTVDTSISLLEGLGVDVIGFNCGLGPEELSPQINRALILSSTPILLMPNAGLPKIIDNKTTYSINPEKFSGFMKKSAENGVLLLGGCCGTTPLHIESLVQNCKNIVPREIKKKNITIASSYSKIVNFGTKPIIIGERINPTGKARLKRAIKEENYDYVLQEGILQVEEGAEVLDVNAGMPGIDEGNILTIFVEHLQSVVDVPLQIDSSDSNALEKAMRIYNGKPIINSVNGKEDSMSSIFPLIQKYGGLIVALTLDENGIPNTVQARLDIAKKILNYAHKFNIPKEAFLFDPLTMPVSTDNNSAKITLECISTLKKELGVKTILGVSNISFGLANRDVLNTCFYHLAIDKGLDAAIINPNMLKEYNINSRQNDIVLDALLGKDEHFKKYLEQYSIEHHEPAKPDLNIEEMTLSQVIFSGLKQRAPLSAKNSLLKLKPMEVIEQELIPALNKAGNYFEQGKIYLPQLLMCAEAAKEAFSIVRKAMGSSADDTIGTVVLATVEGDIHDIGKNIVRALLESHRFKVIDLGKDVPVKKVVEAVIKHNAKLVGLSALMTTTVMSMEKTIRALRLDAPPCKIMCGGAVLTKEYAEKIGADFYGKDAPASIYYAKEVLL
ncbi:MAG: homocysteine S-methyltransferase family protein [Treponema sp.]|nr:homocysteine S-methyltransferase family protein [Treponema sp.]